jgi:hypothetical protein
LKECACKLPVGYRLNPGPPTIRPVPSVKGANAPIVLKNSAS